MLDRFSLRKLRTLALSAVLVSATAALLPDPGNAQFTDVTPPLLADVGRTWGVAWGDYDGDGDPDLLAMNTGITWTQTYRNNGGGNFEMAPGVPAFIIGIAAIWADVDNDGDQDLYTTKMGQANVFYRNSGGSLVLESNPVIEDPGQSMVAGWVDLDNDGYLDVIVGNVGQATRHYHNQGDGSFVEASAAPLSDVNMPHAMAWGDYDNDGDLDLYQANNGADRLLRNDGGGAFSDVTAAPLGNTAWARDAAWGDYDNDGDLDLYLTNDWYSPNQLFRNDGGVFVDATGGPLGDGGRGFSGQWADYDNDGDLDLYVVNFDAAHPNQLLRNDGAGVFASVANGALNDTLAGISMGWADYDADGDLDIYVGNYEAPNRLLRNDLAGGNHWLHLDLVGTLSNRDAIGARVRVVAGGSRQVREITTSTGRCQNWHTVAFGLGSQSVVDTLEVRWPSGIVWDTTNVAVDQRATLVEHESSVAIGSGRGAPGGLSLEGASPNPFRAVTRLRFALAAAGPIRMTVHDLQGRRLATLAEGWTEPGPHELTWSGLGEGGRSLGAGLYFVRLEAAGEARTAKVVLER